MELKIQCPQGRAGSTPAAGIVLKTRFSDLAFFIFPPIFLSELLKITIFLNNYFYLVNIFYFIFTKSSIISHYF